MIYPILLLLLIAESFVELLISIRNSKALIAKGAVEIAPAILPLMTAIYVMKYAGSLVEYYFTRPMLPLWWLILFGGIILGAKGLKFWAISTLGNLWTMRVLIVPGTSVVTKGPYRYLRHPNYVAVMLEVAAIPLLGKAFATMILVTTLFAIVLFFRIRAEEKGLLNYTDYEQRF